MVFYELWFMADFSIINVKQSWTQQFIKNSLYLKVTFNFVRDGLNLRTISTKILVHRNYNECLNIILKTVLKLICQCQWNQYCKLWIQLKCNFIISVTCSQWTTFHCSVPFIQYLFVQGSSLAPVFIIFLKF